MREDGFKLTHILPYKDRIILKKGKLENDSCLRSKTKLTMIDQFVLMIYEIKRHHIFVSCKVAQKILYML